MIVTIVSDVLGPENNGTTIAAMNLARSLRAKGHQVRFICPEADHPQDFDCYTVPAYSFGKALDRYVAKNGVTIARAEPEIMARAIDGADVVHVMIPFSLGKAAAQMAHERGIPVTAGFHCQAENITNHLFLQNFPLANHLVYRAIDRRLYRHCDMIHYPTQFICDVFEKEIGRTTPHRVISNGVNKAFHPQPATRDPAWGDRFVILFTGRYSKEKSHRVLIDGVAASAHRNHIQLVFAGSGPQEQALREYAAKKLSVQPIFGFYSRQDLLRIINAANLYVHPAEIEIEAISCLEAIACGKVPVISDSPRSATRYFALDDKNRFACNDPADLAAKIDYWIEHPDALARRSQEYVGYASQFDYDRCMDRMEAMLKDAVAMAPLPISEQAQPAK